MTRPVPTPEGWADASFARTRESRIRWAAGSVLAVAGLCLATYGVARGIGVAVGLALAPIALGGGLAARAAGLQPPVRVGPRLMPPHARTDAGWRLRFDGEDRYGWRTVSCLARLVACVGVTFIFIDFPRPVIRFFGGFGTASVVAQVATWVAGGVGAFSLLALFYWGRLWFLPRRRLTVDTDAITVGRGEDTVRITWERITDVSPHITCIPGLLGRSRPDRERAVVLTLAPSAPDLGRVSADTGVTYRSAITAGPPATAIVAVEHLRAHPAVVLAALEHYHRNPGERELLGEHTWPAVPA